MPTAEISDRAWYIVSRWQEYQGELRANLLRILCVLTLYTTHLISHYFLLESAEQAKQRVFHQSLTLLCSGWVFVALGVQLCLRRQWLPAVMGYVTTALDIVLVTAAANFGQGPSSPAVFGYFLVIALAGLRFQVLLLWFASLSGVLGYLSLLALGHRDWLGSSVAPREVAQVDIAMVIASLLLCGIVVGQIVRQAPNMAGEYLERMKILEENESRSEAPIASEKVKLKRA